MRPTQRRNIRIALLALLLIVLSCLVWGFFIEPNRLVVHQESIRIDNWPTELNGLRIALIGDLHTDNRFIDAQKLVVS